MPRYWGFWTRGKLDLLRRYLDAFTTAAKRSRESIYLDVFGGQPENRDRLTDELLDGSAQIALNTQNPPFTRLRFFELEPYASRLRTSLQATHAGRDFKVISGDCNETIQGALTDLAHLNWAPTFAFVDPNGPDTTWATLEALARFKRPESTKTEIWLLLAAGMFIRTLPTSGNVRDVDARTLTLMYGTEQWRTIYEARVRGDLAPGNAREEYVNLMRWRLQHVLGYRRTHPLEVFNEQGGSMYHMIFATDHDAGDRIMTSLYRRAVQEFPAMRNAARQMRRRLEEEAVGISTLFGDDLDAHATAGNEGVYTYTAPWVPYGTHDE